MLRTRSTKKGHDKMVAKMLIGLVFLVVFVAIGGFVVLAAWDMPVEQTTVEKTLDHNRFLKDSR